MTGIRSMTLLFLLLTLIPAGILGWLGWQSVEPMAQDLRRAARHEVQREVQGEARRAPGRALEAAAALRNQLSDAALHAHDLFPENSPGHALEVLEQELGHGALVLTGSGGRALAPRGPMPLALQHLPEWPWFRDLRSRIARSVGERSDHLLAARSFDAPGLRALAIATATRGDPERAATELSAVGMPALVAAGPLPFELLRQTPAGRSILVRALHTGWLAAVPATAAARARWLAAAGATPEVQARQELRTLHEHGAAPAVVVATVAPGTRLQWIVDPVPFLLPGPGATPQLSLTVEPIGDPPIPLHWVTDDTAREVVSTVWGPIAVTGTHGAIADLETKTTRLRIATLIGVFLLLGMMLTGLALVRRSFMKEHQARRMRDDFIANVSHELKTPLTSLRMHAEMLAEEDLDQETRSAYGRVITAEGARLSSLVDDLLDFSALLRGQRRLEPAPVDLAAAARSMADSWQPLVEREGGRLTLQAVAGTTALVDPIALSRILVNLLQNALRHGRPPRTGGPSELRIVVGPGPSIEVRDNGPGIAAADRERIFDRFHRAAGHSDGVGLGLSLSRELATGCGGTLTCSDRNGETVFRLELPPVPDDGEAP